MGKYIDAECLKAEIRYLKIDVYGEAHQFDIGARSSLTFLESFIDSLQQEQPPLPSNLDEAAENSWAVYEYRESPRGLYSTCYLDGFKAGAEWMAGQEHIADVSKMMEKPEVDLDNHTMMEEIRKCGCNPNEFDIARHFYELGRNARKEE